MKIEHRVGAPGYARMALVLLLALAGVPAAHAVDMFLRFDALVGESTDDSFRGAIDVLDFGETIVGKNCPRFTITKNIDSATPGFAEFVNKGTIAATAVLSVRKSGSPYVYYSVSMENVTVLSIEPEVARTDVRGAETVVLSAKRTILKYTPVKQDGSAGASITKVITCL